MHTDTTMPLLDRLAHARTKVRHYEKEGPTRFPLELAFWKAELESVLAEIDRAAR